LGDMEREDADAILDALPEDEAEQARRFLDYAADTAGGIMKEDFIAVSREVTVGDVLDQLRRNRDRYEDFEVLYAYLVNREKKLSGIVRIRDLAFTDRETRVEDIEIENPLSVNVDDGLKTLNQLFDQHNFLGLPVVDGEQRLVGMISRSDLAEANKRENRNVFLKFSGIIGGEEFRSMPLFQRSFKRLSWLGPNIVLNLISASVIAMYQDTLQAAIALAVFLPIISDMSGCSGNQAVAVSIRELSIGLIRPGEFFRVLWKEAGLGLINGMILGVGIGLLAFLWKNNIYLGLVVAGALSLNTLLSVILGGLVPLLLSKFKVDPALASGPLLTTVTDLCGFFFVLSFAGQVLHRL
ncbi:MAG: magnesium transporter, partial [Verrucomicrobiota bacterium]